MKKFALVFLATLTLVCMGSGCSKKYDDETVVKAKEAIQSYIENNFKDIESIKLEEPYESPMGGMKVDGTVNGGAEFSISLNKDFTVGSLSLDERFPELKDECIEKSCE
ncbi:hypothetical protein [Terribacillus sp. DMT04]|uniref:hypothetical protein n=1 Tax=Terribacillus sp. DMT04 TaxID=2850441 RepID=UPI001C2BCCE0|nr:hypothetical protein [Terribacillus sp. DMT04]QXE01964.1 hypothetical protein KS242_01540 [Terribacillus sp. DMT04]